MSTRLNNAQLRRGRTILFVSIARNTAIRPVIQNVPSFLNQKKGSPLPKIQKLNQNKCKEGVTFANVVSGTNFPPLPTPNATVIKPRENKNSSKEIHGIHQEDKSDLAQVIEHVNLISNILKRSPEILQILNNLKNADDDNAKTFLLVEALLDKK
ncbi:hypothetical protein TNCV_2635041 [Trichonephila clavipes]|nr:hypothetical protein TNCV_2635041 [Trichonephila clavipes]